MYPDIVGLGIGNADSKSIQTYITESDITGIQIDWPAKSDPIRSRRYHLNTFLILLPGLKPLLQNGIATTEGQNALKWAVDIALDFGRKYPLDPEDPEGKKSDNEYAWYDMAVGIRSSILSVLYLFSEKAARENISEAKHEALKTIVQDHAVSLSSKANWAHHSNHGYYQSYGLFALASVATSALEKPKELRQLAVFRLLDYLNGKIGTDGLHLEHSTAYHNFILRALISIQPWLDSKTPREMEIYSILDKMIAAQAALIMPNGFFAPLGDTDYALASGKLPFTDTQMENFPADLVHARFPDKNLTHDRVFDGKSSGLIAIKSIATNKSHYLAMTGMFHSRVHKQADDLSVIWSENGCPILTDAARYGYDGKTELESELRAEGYYYDDPKRIFVESSHAHNVVEVDRKTYNRKTSPPYGSALTGAHYGDTFSIIEGEWLNPLGIRQRRITLLQPGKSLLILDRLTSADLQHHELSQWLHFFPCWNVQKNEHHWEGQFDSYWAEQPLGLADKTREVQLKRRFAKRISAQSNSLSVAFAASVTSTNHLHQGDTEPRLQGWTSLSARALQPTPSLVQHAKIDAGQSISMAAYISLDGSVSGLEVLHDADASDLKITTPHGETKLTILCSQDETSITINEQEARTFSRAISPSAQRANEALMNAWKGKLDVSLTLSSTRLQRLKKDPFRTLTRTALRRLKRR